MALFRGIRAAFREFIRVDARSVGQSARHQLKKDGILHSAKQVLLENSKLFVPQFIVAKHVTNVTFASPLRCIATQRILGRRNAKFSYLLAFVPFVFAGEQKKNCEKTFKNADQVLQFIHKGVRELKWKNNFSIAPSKLTDLNINERLGKNSACGAVYSANYKEKEVAVKIMFNYQYASYEQDIVKGFKQEVELLCGPPERLQNKIDDSKALPEHPNIVHAHTYFVDNMPVLEDSLTSYPSALPCSQKGFAHNKTLFLVMEKYSQTLREYIADPKNQKREHSLLLLLQLFEAITHLRRHQVAHGDLKSDNILVKRRGNLCPQLALTDFGHSVYDQTYGLRIPYFTEHVSKGGNSALMAPEIKFCQAGPKKYLDYDKADVWGAGALSFEIFGQKNPLYTKDILDPGELKPFTGGRQPFLDKLIQLLLQEDPKKRIPASLAATYLHLLIFSPWPNLYHGMPKETDVQRWIYSTRLAAINYLLQEKNNGDDSLEMELRLVFLDRVHLDEVMDALQLMYK